MKFGLRDSGKDGEHNGGEFMETSKICFSQGTIFFGTESFDRVHWYFLSTVCRFTCKYMALGHCWPGAGCHWPRIGRVLYIYWVTFIVTFECTGALLNFVCYDC